MVWWCHHMASAYHHGAYGKQQLSYQMTFFGCVRQLHRVSWDAFQLIFLYMSLYEEVITRIPSSIALAYVTVIRANGSWHPVVRHNPPFFHDFDGVNDIRTSKEQIFLMRWQAGDKVRGSVQKWGKTCCSSCGDWQSRPAQLKHCQLPPGYDW